MNNVPCKYLEHWRENQSPLGSGEYWPMDMEDCSHIGFEDISKQIELERYGGCDVNCPGYKPMELAVCAKHGEYVKDWGCFDCMADEQYCDGVKGQDAVGKVK